MIPIVSLIQLNRQRELRTHMATIHGTGKYWSCPKCNYNATTKQLLQVGSLAIQLQNTCCRYVTKWQPLKYSVADRALLKIQQESYSFDTIIHGTITNPRQENARHDKP